MQRSVKHNICPQTVVKQPWLAWMNVFQVAACHCRSEVTLMQGSHSTLSCCDVNMQGRRNWRWDTTAPGSAGKKAVLRPAMTPRLDARIKLLYRLYTESWQRCTVPRGAGCCRPAACPTVGAVGNVSDSKVLPSADMVSCVSVELLEVTASGEMTQHYSAYESFCGSAPSPAASVVLSVLRAANERHIWALFIAFALFLGR